MVGNSFLFAIMERFGVLQAFVKLLHFSFLNPKAPVNYNERESEALQIGQEVLQDCLQAPYMFLFISKVLNVAAKQLLKDASLHGIDILDAAKQQLILQYTDNTSFTNLREEESLQVATAFLNCFKFVSFGSLHCPNYSILRLVCTWPSKSSTTSFSKTQQKAYVLVDLEGVLY